MNSLWILCFSILIVYHFQFCNSTYIFTQNDFGTSVCKSEIYDENCPEGTPTIFNGPKKNVPMNLGFLNKTSDIFYDGYNMTEFGFPIFFEYFLDNENLNVNLIIANGKQSKVGNGLYYYVSLIDDEGICGKTRPTTEKETLSGGLYLNQRKAKYAYYIYQSPDSTCILTIEFDDLFQGDYETKNPKKIKPQEINLIASKVKGFYYPFFTIDSILGTAVFLTFKDDKLSAVHYKIDENDLTNFKKVLSLSLTLDSKSDGGESILWYFENPYNYKNSNPTFTSFAKSTFLFFAIEEYSNVIGIWSPKYAHATLLDIDDNHRRFYFLDSDYLNYFTMDYFEEDTEYETFSNLLSNSSSTSFIHLNKAYFQKNQEIEKVSDL
uniref:Uncharacterized protein n=1 Tax=Panagrolaimus davidi TaxID=227884 RepID=A0A914PHK0_9BILA